MGKRVTAYVETEVDVHLSDFEEDDIIDYLESQGYTVMEGKNNSTFDNFADLDKKIWQLYLTYKSDNGAGPQMDKELGIFFAEYYNKVNV